MNSARRGRTLWFCATPPKRGENDSQPGRLPPRCSLRSARSEDVPRPVRGARRLPMTRPSCPSASCRHGARRRRHSCRRLDHVQTLHAVQAGQDRRRHQRRDARPPEGDAYDGVARGGITRIRYSQFTKNVVRVVLTLDAPHAYDVLADERRAAHQRRRRPTKFEPWQVDAVPRPTRCAGASRRQRAVQQPPVQQAPVRARASQASRCAAIVPAPAAPESLTRAPAASKFAQQQPGTAHHHQLGERVDQRRAGDVRQPSPAARSCPRRTSPGTVTANIINLPWDVALKEIMNANGYDVTVNPDGVIVIDTFEAIAARQSTIPLQTRTVRLNYCARPRREGHGAARLTRTCAPSAASAACAGRRLRRRRSPRRSHAASAIIRASVPGARHGHGRHDHQQRQHHRRAVGARRSSGSTHAASIFASRR